jgi:hypothetical protein
MRLLIWKNYFHPELIGTAIAQEDTAISITMGKESERMPKIQKYFGLCETCEHDATCMLRRSAQLKIIQCEEFSTQPTAAKIKTSQNEVLLSDAPEYARMGLCANCLNVTGCGFPNARQGVLQCEEYLLDEAGVIPPIEPRRSRSAA